MEEIIEEPLVDKREELMVSSTTKTKQILRMAHFLNPTHPSIKPPFPQNPKLLSSSSLPPTSDTKRKPVKVVLRGWRNQSAEWGSWVQNLEPFYGSVWKKAGIYEAIISSTFKFQPDNNVIIGLAEKWCLDTNTFIFPWGEATISLQDMMVLGGFSVFGSPVFSSFPEGKGMKKIEEKLRNAKKEASNPTAWMMMFKYSGSEIEHEAFLSLWLQKFVFNDSDLRLQARIFSIAIRLAEGEAFALAPAVLASIYRDLGLLKTTIVAALECKENENCSNQPELALTLCSPLHLVQLWAWERFPTFQPFPNVIKNSDPRSALWENLKKVNKFESVRSDLGSAAEDFRWLPYNLHSFHLHKLYKVEDQWKHSRSNNRVLLAYALCLRVSELVGLDYCIQRYLPHRVARQFGLDQDIPSDIAEAGDLPDLAWSNYIRPFSDIKVFVPSQFSKPDVTIRYLEWWNLTPIINSPDRLNDAIFNHGRRTRRSMTISKRAPQAWIGEPVERIAQADAAIEPFPSITQANAVIEPVEMIARGEAMIGASLNELEEDNISEHSNRSRYRGEHADDYRSDIPGRALEARIAVLEEVVAKLKAARGLKN
ncbi:Aminotransferase-like plant mobile domain family protein [Euphorbia peplus]|nr:Aminotransferase-like plant mobile domain family protein [Euphorbia peplus]